MHLTFTCKSFSLGLTLISKDSAHWSSLSSLLILLFFSLSCIPTSFPTVKKAIFSLSPFKCLKFSALQCTGFEKAMEMMLLPVPAGLPRLLAPGQISTNSRAELALWVCRLRYDCSSSSVWPSATQKSIVKHQWVFCFPSLRFPLLETLLWHFARLGQHGLSQIKQFSFSAER